MLSITHMAMGAGIAHLFPNPAIYIPLTLASHYIGDGIVHWDMGTGIDDGSKSKKLAVFHELIELGLAVYYLYLVFSFPTQGNVESYHVWIAAFVSLIPDFLEAPANFLHWNPPLLKPLNDFHGKFHNSTKDMIVGLTPQLIFLFLVYIFA